MKHRNSQKRIYQKGVIYFVTVNTNGRFPYFDLNYDNGREGDTSSCRLRQDWRSHILSQLWVGELQLLKQIKPFDLHAWCLLPDHFHMMVQPQGDENISTIMKSFKENSSRDINRILNNSQWTGDTTTCRLQIRSQIKKYQQKFHSKKSQMAFPPFQWQKSFHDHIIRNEKDFQNHWYYTTYNYQKHLLSLEWPWSSGKIENIQTAQF